MSSDSLKAMLETLSDASTASGVYSYVIAGACADAVPDQLEGLAKRCGATAADMALFISLKARKRPRGPGFYRVVAKQDFREWWAEVQQARDALAAKPEPDSGWRVGGRDCPHCGGPTETWIEDERYGRCRRCDGVENWRLAS